ncbi:preprotein translocase, SecY subunit [Petrotoga mobilis SJ95]|jgi:preprotein translocase subunit SecY|uniref:Protein translocase subunit SecY n=1 Tax=Petrotoga mobilis (strain DSM 10674 / SJ95) TaxID=403833 RepID=A9BFZ8_PETMO|nr:MULTISPECIES: preprotein translocase subunit SecY [Petrotoga]MDK2812081.1 preprotein translocase subunit SecY [Petrotoga sp.]ABX31494.1 preprotein translocase, SecY subunit [Petrotoga mobilis SJ95]MBL5981784.1 preprotein translocase subunit SecY [Petrotoga sp. 8T1HF07.NaAc.6.1]PNR89731.1 preprotein translocase subunit SecY [Petrotoga sp. 9T1HF07.CasAA.8.2]PNR91898.1 preprotein translocase subunit SecY [Petrotoga sp. HWHPT.55.6.3]
MFKAFRNVFRIPELRDRVIFTFLALIGFRIGIYIPIPGINVEAWQAALSGASQGAVGGFIGFFDVFAGGALSNLSIFVLSVTPYITASIIFQLLSSIIPSLKEMLREGESGRKKFAHYTRMLTLVLAFGQGLLMSIAANNYRSPNLSPVLFVTLATVSIAAGTMFLLWIGELITEKGIGNGVSVLIFAGIVSRYPTYAAEALIGLTPLEWILLAAVAIFIVIAVVAVQTSERRINIQYAKRVVGTKIYGGSSTYLPIKVNGGGVIPIIFASAIMTLPSMIAGVTNTTVDDRLFAIGSPLYLVLYGLLVFFFTYFYSSVVMDPNDVANNIQNYGGFIPGLRPGKPTVNYITSVMTRVTFIGAIFLVVIALVPYFIRGASGMQQIWIGGTSTLIAVGVALDIVQQMEQHMIVRQYEGFMKKGRLRGRR